ncbi:glycosyltransferase, partial [Gilliamella sp. wkB171]|uniref:glycosyltransferase n=1 Tax=Gilliamella sp. wkB171 TaxID=3120258 RepID=UPI002FF7F521
MYCNTGSVIKKKLIFSASNLGKANLLNIAYGIDKNFFLGCAISITSILLTNPDNYFNFHIFTN